MKMALGFPVMNGHELTRDAIQAAVSHAADLDQMTVVILDNGSDPPYKARKSDPWGGTRTYDVLVLNNRVNKGYYSPLTDMVRKFPDMDIYALAHNDLFIEEDGWDNRIRGAFISDPKLGVIGFCGSWAIDHAGGRDGGTMCYFTGRRGQSQNAGLRIDNLRPSLILDSLFMAFRAEVIPALQIDGSETPAHFYDKIWPTRAIQAGWRVATLGVAVDHMGGMTLVAEPNYELDMRRWCESQGIDWGDNAGAAVYREAERRWLEYRTEGYFPCWIDESYTVHR